MIAEVAVERLRPSRRWWLVVSLLAHAAAIAAAMATRDPVVQRAELPVPPRATTVELRRVPRHTDAPRCGPARPVPTRTPAGLIRLAGETQIAPSDADKQAMVAAGRHRVSAAFRYCVGRQGSVRSVKRFKSTGYPDYDARLEQGIRAWTFAPEDEICDQVAFLFTLCD